MSYQPLNPAGQPAGPVVYAPVVVPGSVVVGGPAVSLLSPPHEWQVELCNTCIESPGSWLYAACCPACSAYDQRVRLLAFTGEPYSCCQQKSLPHPGDCCTAPYQPPPAYPPPMWPPVEGAMPQVMTEFQCELCMEATCCHPCAIGSTRRLMQYKFGVQNSSCDDLTICCVLLCCCTNRRDNTRSAGFAALNACLTTQQDIELRFEETRRLNAVIMPAGPMQQSMGSPVAYAGEAPKMAAQQPYHPPQQQQQYYQGQPQQYQQGPPVQYQTYQPNAPSGPPPTYM